MHVVHWRTRQIVIDDGAQPNDIEAARRQISRHEHPNTPALQVGERLRSATLTHAAVQRRCGEASLHELARDVLGAVLAGHEHQHAGPSVLVEQMAQQQRARAHVHLERALLDQRATGQHLGFDRDPLGLLEQLFSQGLHGVREGRRKQQLLATRRQQREHVRQLLGEAEREHAIRFVEHQRLERRKPQRIAAQQVEQAAWRRDHDVDTPPQGHHLRIDRHATFREARPERRQVTLKAPDRALDLRGQLTRGQQHQRSHIAERLLTARAQRFDDGQQKRGRLARPGRCRRPNITPRQDRGNGRVLNRRGRLVLEIRQCTQQRLAQAQGSKSHGRA